MTRDACDAREGTRGHGDMVTRGDTKIHGRDAIAPLPTSSGGELARWHVGEGRGIIFKEACKGWEKG